MRPAAAVALLAALAAAALLAEHVWSVGVIALVLILVCLRAPRSRRRFYLIGTLLSAGALFVVTPFVETIGSHPVWTGPIIRRIENDPRFADRLKPLFHVAIETTREQAPHSIGR